MKNIYIYCEGQTEESFINRILFPYFIEFDIFVRPIICETKRTNEKKYRGGVCDYNHIKRELTTLCKSHRNEIITTMFDYYAMPQNTPEINYHEIDIYKRVNYIENKINKDINQNNLSFHLMLHEFEGILFSNPNSFSLITDESTVRKIQKIRDEYMTPEYINNSYETAPSKRIKKLIPNYAKVRHGTILAENMGINVMMQQCLHFNEWILKMKDMTGM